MSELQSNQGITKSKNPIPDQNNTDKADGAENRAENPLSGVDISANNNAAVRVRVLLRVEKPGAYSLLGFRSVITLTGATAKGNDPDPAEINRQDIIVTSEKGEV